MTKSYNIFSLKANEEEKKEDGMSKLQAFLKYNTVWSFKTLELFKF
jgi:hypothetical protein